MNNSESAKLTTCFMGLHYWKNIRLFFSREWRYEWIKHSSWLPTKICSTLLVDEVYLKKRTIFPGANLKENCKVSESSEKKTAKRLLTLFCLTACVGCLWNGCFSDSTSFLHFTTFRVCGLSTTTSALQQEDALTDRNSSIFKQCPAFHRRD